MVVIKSILEQDVVLDESLWGSDATTTQFIYDLLDKNQSTRLGCGTQLLMSNHQFFKKGIGMEVESGGFDDMDELGGMSSWWEQLIQRALEAPWLPGTVAEEDIILDSTSTGKELRNEPFVGNNKVFEGF